MWSAARAMATRSGVTSPRMRIARPGLFPSVRINIVKGNLWYIPRERVAHHKVFVDAHLFAELSNLILEHFSQRLDQFELPGAVSEWCRHDQRTVLEIWVPKDSRRGKAGMHGNVWGSVNMYLESVGQASDIVMGLDGGTRS